MLPSMKRSRSRPRYAAAGAAVATGLVLLAFFLLGRVWEASRHPPSHSKPQNSVERAWAFQGGDTDTLVVYIFSNTDPEYLYNLKFFLKFGVREEDGADYVIVLQQDSAEVWNRTLETNKPNIGVLRVA